MVRPKNIFTSNKKRYAVTLFLGILFLGIVGIFCWKCNQFKDVVEQREDVKKEKDEIAFSNESEYVVIENPYLYLHFPEEYSQHIFHQQEVRGGITTEVFYMLIDETQIPLYRIDFGDDTAGDWLGVLKTEEGDIPITYTVFVVGEEELLTLGEEATEIYNVLMNGFNVLLDSIYMDERFSSEKEISVGEVQEAKLTYWTLNLPGNMSWSEETINGNYQATFYGDIQGEQVALYTVQIGDDEAETVLGLYKLDGIEKKVSVESYSLEQYGDWSEDDFSAAYLMMDTINIVIGEILSDEKFSELSQEVVMETGSISN